MSMALVLTAPNRTIRISKILSFVLDKDAYTPYSQLTLTCVRVV